MNINFTDVWKSEGLPSNPNVRLTNTVSIEGVLFHAEAIRVAMDDVDHVQEVDGTASPWVFEILSDISRASCNNGPLSTVKIPGYDGDYVIAILPSAD